MSRSLLQIYTSGVTLATLIPLFALCPGRCSADAVGRYGSSFEAPEFPLGPVGRTELWLPLSSGVATVDIVEGSDGVPPPPDGKQMLRLVRPSTKDIPRISYTYRPLKEAIESPFKCSFLIAYHKKSGFPFFSVQLDNSGASGSGASVGIGIVDEPGKKRKVAFVYKEGNEIRKLAPTAEAAAQDAPRPEVFYRFVIELHPADATYNLQVYENETLLGSAEAIAFPGDARAINRVIISIAGGSMDDTMVLDALRIEEM